MRFNYFRPEEAEQYDFYSIPKALFTDPRYRKVSLQAKLLYGELLDRMNRSTENGWTDESGRVFLALTLQDIMELLQCQQEKANRLLQELDTEHGIGLIEQKKQDTEITSCIYIRRF